MTNQAAEASAPAYDYGVHPWGEKKGGGGWG